MGLEVEVVSQGGCEWAVDATVAPKFEAPAWGMGLVEIVPPGASQGVADSDEREVT